MSFSPANFVKIAADSIGQLRRSDVWRVLNSCPSAHLQDMARFIRQNRPEYADEIDDCLWEIHDELMAECGAADPRA